MLAVIASAVVVIVVAAEVVAIAVLAAVVSLIAATGNRGLFSNNIFNNQLILADVNTTSN